MRRLLFCLLFTFSSMTVFAQTTIEQPPSFFEIAEEDVSVYYLGAIFGNQLIPGGTEMHLLSHLFEVFNMTVLAVGLIIIIYSLMAGALHTARQGKPLGEKWNAVWMPVRIVIGMSLLIPKAGTGYCMAQYLTMWLVLQGVGAADTLWSKMLDYFIEGGAIYSNSTGKSGSYMNKGNLENTYELEQYVLIRAACVEAHNESSNSDVFGEYKIYSSDDYRYVNFGNPKVWEEGKPGGPGQECGAITMPDVSSVPIEEQSLVLQTYNHAFYNMTQGLSDIGKLLGSEDGIDDTQWPDNFPLMQTTAVTFIEYLKGASQILFPNENPGSDDQERQKLEELKKYGWILAGNYYMTLSNFSDEMTAIRIIIPSAQTMDIDPSGTAQENYAQAIQNAKDFWAVETTDPRYANTFAAWPDEEKYNSIPGYVDEYDNVAIENKYGVSKAELDNIKGYLKGLGHMSGSSSTSTSSTMSPVYYMDQITGFEGDNRDPILKAAKFGGKLTMISALMVVIFFPVMLGIVAVFWWKGWLPFMAGMDLTIPAMIFMWAAPVVVGIAGFLYLQGVMLGVILPLVPFTIFAVGAVGWFLGVIESIVAAPLVAVGLLFPETQQDVWGRAEPAYMMILNLFLRPSLMIVGLAAGMVLSWVAIELLNAAYYLFIVDAAHIENILFGYIVLTLVYVAILIGIVTKAFGIINELPNRVLMWIGDRSQAQEGAREMLGAMKEAGEKGAGVAGGAFGVGAKVGGQLAGMATGGVPGKFEKDLGFQSLYGKMGDAYNRFREGGLGAIMHPEAYPPPPPGGGPGETPGGAPAITPAALEEQRRRLRPPPPPIE